MPAPVINVAQMREWEQATWATGRTEAEVIGRVGEIVARRAAQMVFPGELVLILAGKGHNGDDVRRARDHMPDGHVHLLNITDPETGLSEVTTWLNQQPQLIIDGLFGIGLNRPLDAAWIAVLAALRVRDPRL